MQSLAFKMLIRKKGTASAIIAIVLLVALITSVDCLVNTLNSQTALLTNLAASGDTYLIVTKPSTCLTGSHVNPDLVDYVKQIPNVRSAAFLCLAQAVIEYNGTSCTVDVVGIDNVTSYFNDHHMYINGSISHSDLQANVGVILANFLSVQITETLKVAINGKTSELKVAGIVQGNTQSDSQIILPLNTFESLNAGSNHSSYLEFSISDMEQAQATLTNITRTLPSDTEIADTRQVTAFASDINSQTVEFISVWSVAVYAIVATASYVITARVVTEAEYDLNMLRVLGAKKPLRSSLVLLYGLIVILVGSVVGVALGIVGTQVASTFVRWVFGTSFLVPFLELPQTFTLLLLSFAAGLLGSLYPAYRAGYCSLGGGQL